MSMNIKDAETHQLARQLAARTGESLTVAVRQAVRERLERVEQQEAPLADRLLAIGKEWAARFREPARSGDHGDLLYDDRGLPA